MTLLKYLSGASLNLWNLTLENIPELICLFRDYDIHELSFNKCKLGDGFYTIFENLKLIPNLRIISLNFLNLNEAHIKYLSQQFEFIPKLKHLSLAGNKIGDDGIKHIADHIHFVPKLFYLNLWQNSIGYIGAKYFLQHISHTRLTHYCLFANEVSENFLLEYSKSQSDVGAYTKPAKYI